MVQDFTEEQLLSLQKRTVKVLSLGQSLGGFGLGATLSVGALLAVELSGTTAWSGAAATLSTLGSAAVAIPLANLAFRRGRRVSLAFGAFLAILGATMMILATYTQSFPVEIVALLFLGAGSAVSLQARFAAADIPTGKPKGRDLSLVVWATTLGAVIGPNLIAPGETLGLWLGMPHLAGPFLFTIAAQLCSTLVFWFGLASEWQHTGCKRTHGRRRLTGIPWLVNCLVRVFKVFFVAVTCCKKLSLGRRWRAPGRRWLSF
jgi:MFS family permease